MAGALTYALSLKTQGFTGPLKSARGGLNKFGSGVGGLLTKLGSMAAGMIAVGGAAGAMAIGMKAFTAAADMESTQASFKTLLDSEEDALSLLKKIKETAASTPESFVDLASAARGLLSVSGKDGVIEDLRMIGDLASASQKPIGQLAAMYAKVKGGGLVQGEDLNQIVDALGGQALDEFANVLGVGREEVRKLGSEGKITGGHLEEVFRNMTAEGGMAFGAMAAQSQTTNGLISTLKDNVHELFLTLGTPINDALKPVFQQAIVMVKKVGLALAGIIDITKGAIANGSLGEMIGKVLKIGLMEGVNYGAGAFVFLAEGMYNAFKFSFLQVWTLMTGGFGESFGNIFGGVVKMIGGLGKMILSKLSTPFLEVVSMFQAGLSVAVDKLLEKLGKIPIIGEKLGLKGYEADSFEEALEYFRELNKPAKLNEDGNNLFDEGLTQASKGVGQQFDVVAENFRKSFGDMKFEPVGLFDVSDDKKELEALAKKASPDGWEKLLSSLNSANTKAESAADKPAKKPTPKPSGGNLTDKQQVEQDRIDSKPKRRGLLGAAESLATRYSRQSKTDKGSFKDFAMKSGTDRSAVRQYAKNNKLSMGDALAQLGKGSRAASPRQARRNASEKAARDAASKAATEGTLLKIAANMENFAVA